MTRWPVDPLTFSKKNPSRANGRSTYIHPPSLAKIRQRTSEETGNTQTHTQTNAARIIVWYYTRICGFCTLTIIPKSLGGHLLDNLDDKPTDETERAPIKKKISFAYCFFILTHRASPVSGLQHRLATVQQTFWSAWYMHNATAADWPA